MIITNLKKKNIGSKGTHLLKLKQEIRIKRKTMQQKQDATKRFHF